MTWDLTLVGRRSWTEARDHFDDRMTCCWFDLDGLQLGPAPETAPLGTHLWGWSSDRWSRARVDEGNGYIAVLERGRGDEEGVGETTIVVRQAVPWDVNEPQLSRAGRESMQKLEGLGTTWIITAGVLAPITFIHFGPEPAVAETRGSSG